jgi:hypothetical protein
METAFTTSYEAALAPVAQAITDLVLATSEPGSTGKVSGDAALNILPLVQSVAASAQQLADVARRALQVSRDPATQAAIPAALAALDGGTEQVRTSLREERERETG